MSRYRREITHPERELAKLADDAKKLRQEIQSMVRNRRRSDVRADDMPTRRPETPGKRR